MARRITIFLFVAQVVCWFAFIYLLYYGVPLYKMLARDYPIFSTFESDFLVAMSDLVVIYTRSDLGFWLSLLTFLGALTGWSFYIGRPTFRTKEWIMWSIPAFMIPFALLSFEIVTIAVSTKGVIDRHPEVLDYPLWWIKIFA